MKKKHDERDPNERRWHWVKKEVIKEKIDKMYENKKMPEFLTKWISKNIGGVSSGGGQR